MPERPAPIVVTPPACPFVALDGDRDRRRDTPDPLHRCFAEQIPRARSMSHQAEYCLSPNFAACPIFQDWASRAAAETVAPRVPVSPVSPVSPVTQVATRTSSVQALDPLTLDPAAIDDVIATRPVPSYRAVPAPGFAATITGTSAGTAPVERGGTAGSRTSPTSATASSSVGATAPEDDVPVIRSLPAPRSGPAVPAVDDDWTAPPPWLRQPTAPVWVAEAVPPPDAFADVGTQPVRRVRPADSLPDLLAEAAIPTGGEPMLGPSGPFGEETTGMPPDFSLAGSAAPPTQGPATGPPAVPQSAQILEATGTGTGTRQDPGVSAELSAARYRADLLAGLDPDEGTDASEPRPASRQRRVPIDVQAGASLGAQAQARPSVRSTGSREWEGPRRFEAYAATQRRWPPTSLLVGGGAVVLALLLVGVFLLPGLLMGGAPAATQTPAPTGQTAVVVATDTPTRPTPDPERTVKPDKTPRLKTYTVKAGDTLIKIAKRFHTTVTKLSCLNRIKNPNNVTVGRTLTIPPKGYRCSRNN